MKNLKNQAERLIEIASLVDQQGSIQIEQICHELGVSRDSARRDLVKLTESPRYLRVRGGAITASQTAITQPFSQRQQQASMEKWAIAKYALEQISEGQIIFLDSGSTITCLAQQIPDQNLHVITPSLGVAEALADKSCIQLILLGGQFNAKQYAFYGDAGVAELASLNIQMAFIGVCALDKHGLSTHEKAESILKKLAIERAQQTLLLSSGDKLDKTGLYQVSRWEMIDQVITDRPASTSIQQAIAQVDTDWINTEKRQ